MHGRHMKKLCLHQSNINSCPPKSGSLLATGTLCLLNHSSLRSQFRVLHLVHSDKAASALSPYVLTVSRNKTHAKVILPFCSCETPPQTLHADLLCLQHKVTELLSNT